MAEMAKSTTGQTDRTRPSSRLKPQSLLESTPVLFRLPTIQLNILAGTEEGQSEDAHTTADRLSAAGEPGPSLLRVYPEATQEAESVAVSAQPPQTSADVRTAKADFKADLNADSSVGIHSASISLKDSKTSWWEHWSSGVVMILIAIAAITVIVLFVRSTGSSAQNSAKSQALEDEFGDLDLISVPSFEMIASGGMNTTPSEPSNNQVDSDSKAADYEEYSELAAQLASADVSGMPSGTASNEVSSSGMAVAQLLDPTPLLDSPQSGEPTAPVHDDILESSLAAQFPELPAISNSVTDKLSTDRSLTSNIAPENASVAGSALSAAETAISPTETDNSLTPPQLTSSMPNLGGQSSSVPTAATAVSVKQTSKEGKAEGEQAGPKVRATATPDSNEEEIIRAYLELIRTDRSTANTSSEAVNRYQGVR